jgi:hypothetical protein
MALIILCEGKTMRRSLLIMALVLLTVWATGCVIVDAGRVQSRGPVTVRSDSVEIRQGSVLGGPAADVRSDEPLPPAGQ